MILAMRMIAVNLFVMFRLFVSYADLRLFTIEKVAKKIGSYSGLDFCF